MAIKRDNTPGKRKRSILSDDSGDESEELSVVTTEPTPIQSFIRPPTTTWGRSTSVGEQYPSHGESMFGGFGIIQDASKKPRLTSAENPRTNKQDSARPISPGSSENSRDDAVPAVHHMFDVSGRVPPPPRPTHSDDEEEEEEGEEEEEEEEEEDAKMTDAIPTDSLRRSSHSPMAISDNTGVDQAFSGSHSIPSSPPPAVKAPPPSPANLSFITQDKQKMAIHNLMSPHEESTWSRSLATPEASTTDNRLETVTLFIEDKRTSGEDIEMVEVTVQISPGPHGAQYWTVDCEELVDRLQEGPSRVDGSAKVFCSRTNEQGKVLRQCILRLEPEPIVGKGIVRVPLNLELEVVLEKLPPRATFTDEELSQVRADGRVPIPSTPQVKRAPRASLVPGLEEIRAGTVRYQHPEAHWPQPRNGGAYSAEVIATRKPTPQTLSEQASDRAAKSKKAMADYIRPLIQADPFWPTFHESKGHVKSNMDAVKCLQFFQDLVDKYINAHHTIPPQIPYAGGKRLTKAALLEAVGRGTTWSSDCHIVLELIKRFGPGGPDEKPEVLELLRSTSTKGGLTEFVAKMKRIKAEHDRSKAQ